MRGYNNRVDFSKQKNFFHSETTFASLLEYSPKLAANNLAIFWDKFDVFILIIKDKNSIIK